MMSNRRWIMCACSNSPPKASTSDARAFKTAMSPPANAASLAVVYLCGRSARRRSPPRRYNATMTNRRDSSFKGNYSDRPNWSAASEFLNGRPHDNFVNLYVVRLFDCIGNCPCDGSRRNCDLVELLHALRSCFI